MAIHRNRLALDDHYTQVPNVWLRDERLSRRARGLLAELLSHRIGWVVSIPSLMKSGTEGRDALRAAVSELESHGYLVRERARSEAGKFAEVDYHLADPYGFPASEKPTSGNPHPKKNILKEEHLKETSSPDGDAARDGLFLWEEFWEVYPRKVGKQAALKAWKKAAKSTPPAGILAAATVFARDPNLPEKQFIPHPATWINEGRWDDEPLPARADGGQTQRKRNVITDYDD